MKILVIEDEPKTAAYLAKGLRENGYVVDHAGASMIAPSLSWYSERTAIDCGIFCHSFRNCYSC